MKRLLSSDHFPVDGTLIKAWASMRSVKPKADAPTSDAPTKAPPTDDPPRGDAPGGSSGSGGRNAAVNFRGQKRTNTTHASVTDPQARLYLKGPGKETTLCFVGHALMANRNGLLVDACQKQADGHTERIAARAMIEPRADRPLRITLGADKAYDTAGFVNELRAMELTPHVAQNGRVSAIEGRTTQHEGCARSPRIRERTEEGFGWIATTAGQAKTRFRGHERVEWVFTFAAAAYNSSEYRSSW